MIQVSSFLCAFFTRRRCCCLTFITVSFPHNGYIASMGRRGATCGAMGRLFYGLDFCQNKTFQLIPKFKNSFVIHIGDSKHHQWNSSKISRGLQIHMDLARGLMSGAESVILILRHSTRFIQKSEAHKR